MTIRIIHADVVDGLRQLADESVHACVTSPPYFSQRQYLPTDHPDKAREIGTEGTVGEYVDNLVGIFREVRRVLRSDGSLWLNIGDCYASYRDSQLIPDSLRSGNGTAVTVANNRNPAHLRASGLKNKDLIGVPWRVAFALQNDGWYLRSDIVWAKTNPRPESVGDRPIKGHEFVFLLTKAERYYYDAKAIKAVGINTVWPIATEVYTTHYATMPPALAELCIKGGCPLGGTTLDPFSGAGTTCLVADRLQRHGIGIELSSEYAAMSRKRIDGDRGGLLDIMEGAEAKSA